MDMRGNLHGTNHLAQEVQRLRGHLIQVTAERDEARRQLAVLYEHHRHCPEAVSMALCISHEQGHDRALSLDSSAVLSALRALVSSPERRPRAITTAPGGSYSPERHLQPRAATTAPSGGHSPKGRLRAFTTMSSPRHAVSSVLPAATTSRAGYSPERRRTFTTMEAPRHSTSSPERLLRTTTSPASYGVSAAAAAASPAAAAAALATDTDVLSGAAAGVCPGPVLPSVDTGHPSGAAGTASSPCVSPGEGAPLSGLPAALLPRSSSPRAPAATSTSHAGTPTTRTRAGVPTTSSRAATAPNSPRCTTSHHIDPDCNSPRTISYHVDPAFHDSCTSHVNSAFRSPPNNPVRGLFTDCPPRLQCPPDVSTSRSRTGTPSTRARAGAPTTSRSRAGTAPNSPRAALPGGSAAFRADPTLFRAPRVDAASTNASRSGTPTTGRVRAAAPRPSSRPHGNTPTTNRSQAASPTQQPRSTCATPADSAGGEPLSSAQSSDRPPRSATPPTNADHLLQPSNKGQALQAPSGAHAADRLPSPASPVSTFPCDAASPPQPADPSLCGSVTAALMHAARVSSSVPPLPAAHPLLPGGMSGESVSQADEEDAPVHISMAAGAAAASSAGAAAAATAVASA